MDTEELIQEDLIKVLLKELARLFEDQEAFDLLIKNTTDNLDENGKPNGTSVLNIKKFHEDLRELEHARKEATKH